MKVTSLIAAASLMILATAASMAQDSPQDRLQRMTALQSRIADLHAQVVKAPDDRQIFRTLLETGLQYYELIDTGSRFPDSLRNEILDLKIAMQDMYSIQRAVAEIGRPIGIDGNEVNFFAAPPAAESSSRLSANFPSRNEFIELRLSFFA
jgi:hypothetical protein